MGEHRHNPVAQMVAQGRTPGKMAKIAGLVAPVSVSPVPPISLGPPVPGTDKDGNLVIAVPLMLNMVNESAIVGNSIVQVPIGLIAQSTLEDLNRMFNEAVNPPAKQDAPEPDAAIQG